MNNIRYIISKSKTEVEVVIYFIDKAEVDIEIKDFETEKVFGRLKTKAKNGLNTFLIRSDKFEKDKQYRVHINYKCKDNSGSFSNNLTTKY